LTEYFRIRFGRCGDYLDRCHTAVDQGRHFPPDSFRMKIQGARRVRTDADVRARCNKLPGRMLNPAPQSLPNHAFTTHGYPPLNLQGGSEWREDDGLNIGVRVKAIQ
jgi:hypothetical protein